MALDDPVVLILIFALIIFLFGSNKIPGFAKALGEARREFDNAWKGYNNPASRATVPPGAQGASTFIPSTTPALASDPLVIAAQNEGIDTFGKTREQISTELAWKLNKKN
ncbi:MAG: twin-arginine translocase TatA/TatE family subunit [Nitrososphaerales archaeon]